VRERLSELALDFQAGYNVLIANQRSDQLPDTRVRLQGLIVLARGKADPAEIRQRDAVRSLRFGRLGRFELFFEQ